MSRARDLSKLANPSVFSVDTSYNVGLNSTTPDAKLDVIGIVSATAFYGDGSNLEGVASAGLGTELADEGALSVIYYTDNVLTVGSTITVDPPSTTNIAYTQYAEIAVSGDADLIVADGDDLVPDILGLSTEGVTPLAGSGGRVRADSFTNHAGTGAPTFNAGVQVTGVVTATSFSGSGTSLTNIPAEQLTGTLPAIDGSNLTGAGGVSNFIASGNIPNGAAVIVNDDGTVGIITSSINQSSDPTSGTPAIFNGNGIEETASVFDPTSGKVVIAWQDADILNDGSSVVGTVNPDNSITFGNRAVFSDSNIDDVSIAYDSTNDKVVITYRDIGNSNYGTAVVGTVTGTAVTFGTPVVFESNYSSMQHDKAITSIGGGKIVITYRSPAGSDFGKAVVGTVTGTAVTFGIGVTFNSASTSNGHAVYDSTNDRVVISYRDSGNSNYGTAVVGTVTGTAVTFGSEVVFNSSSTSNPASVYDPTNNRVVISYSSSPNSSVVVGEVNAGINSITFGTPVEFKSTTSADISSTYDSTYNKVVTVYRDTANFSYGTVIVGTVDAGINSITFGNPHVFEDGYTIYTGSSFDSINGRTVVTYMDDGDKKQGKAVVIASLQEETNLLSGNYIGIAAETISDGQTGKVNIVSGINTSQSGLTTGRTYYVQIGGGISTVTDNPSVVAGTSISSTKIIVKG